MIDRPVSMLGSVDSILFDNAPVAYSLLDLNGRQIGGNRAYWELFGYHPSEAGSIDVMRLTHPDDRELTRRYFADLLNGQVEETAIEKRYIRKDGSQFLGRLRAKAVKDDIGKPRFLVGVIEDITDAAEANRALREAANAQASFVAAVSHELRSPLHSILGMAELLSFSLSGEDRGRADTIVRQAENLRALIDDILDMSRVQAGVLELRNEDFDPAELATDVVETVASLALDGVEIKAVADRDIPPLVSGPRARLEQVLVNLASNACKYTDKGAINVIARHLEGDFFRFSVTDTGAGINRAHLNEIFEPFRQPDGGRGGVGLGLALSKAIIEQMGGTLEVTSTVGEGSCFWFEVELPRVADVAAGDPTQALETPRRSLGRVLVVDDSEVNRMLAQAQLSRLGYACETASDGTHAVANFEPTRFVAVLMDWYMPEMDGLATTKAIRRMEAANGWDQTPIIAVTASAMPGDREACVAAGMNDFLPKPASLEQLKRVLGKWARRKPEAPKPRPADQPGLGGETAASDEPVIDTKPFEAALRRLERDLGSRTAAVEVFNAFVDEMYEHSANLTQTVNSGDRARAAVAAHSLKGASRSVGAVGIATLCEAVERSARSYNADFSETALQIVEQVERIAPAMRKAVAG